MRIRPLCLMTACVALAAGAGCGYRAGFLIPPDVRSVHIEVAANETFWREATKTDNLDTGAALPAPRPAYPMVADLTEAIQREVMRRTPLKISHTSDADSVLSATITDVNLRARRRDGADNLVVGEVDLSVDFVWTDRRSGRVIAQRTGIRRPTEYYVRQGETFTTAARRSMDYIAEMIVEAMQEGF